MKVIYGVESWQCKPEPLFLALGNFDGVHRGHQAIIKATVEKAKQSGGISAALIFDPHPTVLLNPDPTFALLTGLEERRDMIGALGIDYLIVEPFTPELAALHPEDFISVFLAGKLRVKGIVVGLDYSFGAGGAGKPEMLKRWGGKLSFSVTVLPLLRYKGRLVSSSAIRALLADGQVDAAADLLNYFYFRKGQVSRGKGIGKESIYPTANLSVGPPLLWPAKGVYLTAIGGLGDLRFGVTNIGSRPTFGRKETAAETHIFDFEGDLYNREISIYFLDKLRDTIIFDTPGELKKQVDKDIEKSKRMLEKRYGSLKRLTGEKSLFPAASS